MEKEKDAVMEISPLEEVKPEKEKKKKEKKEKKAKKEKKPLDAAAKKKRRRIIMFSAAGVLILALVVKNMFFKSETAAFVATAGAVSGEIEQTINTSGTVTTEKSRNYFSDVSVRIGSIPVAAGDSVKAGDVLISYDADELAQEKELAKLKAQSAEGSYLNSVQGNNEKLGDLNEANVNLEVLDQQIKDTEAYITNLNHEKERFILFCHSPADYPDRGSGQPDGR